LLLLPSTRGQIEQCYSARVRRGGGRLGFSPYSVFKEKKRGERRDNAVLVKLQLNFEIFGNGP
jgi:hypothetical protein